MWPYSESETISIVERIALEVDERFSGHVEFLAKGSNNEVFLVGSGEARFVVRVTGSWREIKTYRERWCYRQAEAVDIPGPRVLAVGKVKELPYIAMSFVSGEVGTAILADHERIWRTLGRYARLVNSFADGSGPIVERDLTLYEDARCGWLMVLLRLRPYSARRSLQHPSRD